MNDRGSTSQHGFSVVEMLIVLVVLGILIAFAVMAMGGSADNMERQNITRELKVALERARFDSVKRRASRCEDMSRVILNGTTSFDHVTDLNQDGTTLDDNGTPGDLTDDFTSPAEIRSVNFSPRSTVEIVSPAFADPPVPITIRFDQRGHATTGPCGSEIPVDPTTIPIVFCNMPCTAGSAGTGNSSQIFVSPTGTMAYMNGGQPVPSFANTTLANVNADAQIPNPDLAVWTGSPPTPSPFPTPTPTPAPTATPSPTDPSLPTPTPAAHCNTSPPYQAPAVTGCQCTDPTMEISNPGAKCRPK